MYNLVKIFQQTIKFQLKNAKKNFRSKYATRPYK